MDLEQVFITRQMRRQPICHFMIVAVEKSYVMNLIAHKLALPAQKDASSMDLDLILIEREDIKSLRWFISIYLNIMFIPGTFIRNEG